jgi:hypothetical protein
MSGSKRHWRRVIKVAELDAAFNFHSETICVLPERERTGTISTELAPTDIKNARHRTFGAFEDRPDSSSFEEISTAHASVWEAR